MDRPARRKQKRPENRGHSSARGRAPRGQSNIPIDIGTASSRRASMPTVVNIILVLLLCLAAVYGMNWLHQSLTPNVATEIVTMSNMDEQRSISGMIVRSEEVFYAPRSGRFEPVIMETDRVRQGTLVGNIQDVNAIARLDQDLANIEERIRRLGSLRHFSESDATVQRINTNIQNVMNTGMHSFATGNLSDINNLHNRLSQLTENRNQIVLNYDIRAVGDIGRQHTQMSELRGLNHINMYAVGTGIMFQIVDGHEHWNPGNMRSMSREAVNETVDHAVLFPKRDVEAGDPLFKVVGNAWYVVSFMPHEMAQQFTLGADRVVFLHNDVTGVYEPMTMRIAHLERHALDTKVIFRSTRNVINFLGQRNVSIRVSDYVARGLKVSNSAIVERRYIAIPLTHVQEGVNYFVHHRTEEGIRTVAIEVASRTEDSVYVEESTLSLIMGDALAPIALFGSDYMITEAAVRLSHGVYLATRGYAYFTTISLGGDLSEVDGYTLLDPSRNPNLRQFDTIVTDATQVEHRQILRNR